MISRSLETILFKRWSQSIFNETKERNMKNFKKSLSSSEGFTLVELMVVVAIIGVLAAVAIPNFKKYQAKAKTSEAKIILASMYSAEESYMAEYNSYSDCFEVLGLEDGTDTSAYYTYGFSTNTAKNATANLAKGTGGCVGTNETFRIGGKLVSGAAVPTDETPIPTAKLHDADADGSLYEEYVSGAGGFVDASVVAAAKYDQWTINESKVILHPSIGY